MLMDRVEALVKEHRLFSPGQRVIVAFSGGPDSMTLLHVLLAISQRLSLQLSLAHLNHQIRPEAAADVAFVEKVAKALHLPLRVKTVNVPRLADQQRISLEEAAREARYRFFAEVAQESDAQAVALAHHADDQVETILMRLIRGTGMRGLQGIPIKRPLLPGVSVVRPLLETTREEILYYLREAQLSFVLDHSNEVTKVHVVIRELKPINGGPKAYAIPVEL